MPPTQVAALAALPQCWPLTTFSFACLFFFCIEGLFVPFAYSSIIRHEHYKYLLPHNPQSIRFVFTILLMNKILLYDTVELVKFFR